MLFVYTVYRYFAQVLFYFISIQLFPLFFVVSGVSVGRKVYGNGKVAVKGLDMDLFEGHISVLLGHNGAGKSTAISMITGTLPSTEGEAYLRYVLYWTVRLNIYFR